MINGISYILILKPFIYL